MSSVKKNDNETAVRLSLSSDRRIMVEVLTMEIIERRWSPIRTGSRFSFSFA
jgi:hypothetical protein